MKWIELYKPFPLGPRLCEPSGHEERTRSDGQPGPHFLPFGQTIYGTSKNMRLAVIENCGHVCSIEAPDVFNELVLRFLQDLDVPDAVTATGADELVGVESPAEGLR